LTEVASRRFSGSLARVTLGLLATAGIGGAPPGCSPARQPDAPRWKLTSQAEPLVADPGLRARIFAALDAAEKAGTDPSLSKFPVRAATVIQVDGATREILGGNSEYAGLPEAIHGETSLLNHVINAVGPEAARRSVDFIAFYSERCGGGGSCGDCRDYLMTTTRWRELLVVCGQAGDHSVHVDRFAKGIVGEDQFPEVPLSAIGLPARRVDELARAAGEARRGGVRLFTPDAEHLGVAALTTTGRIYCAAGADDAAFHYRYPVGAALQQAATYRDYFVQAVVVAGAAGRLPRLRYRDRQYGYEFSSFNRKRGLAPIRLILVEEAPEAAPPARRYRLTTFEQALPGAFSATDFMPDAVDRFLEQALLR
jgi:cytidine deaminase